MPSNKSIPANITGPQRARRDSHEWDYRIWSQMILLTGIHQRGPRDNNVKHRGKDLLSTSQTPYIVAA